MTVAESTHKWYRDRPRLTKEQVREENEEYYRWWLERADQLRRKREQVRVVL